VRKDKETIKAVKLFKNS